MIRIVSCLRHYQLSCYYVG